MKALQWRCWIQVAVLAASFGAWAAAAQSDTAQSSSASGSAAAGSSPAGYSVGFVPSEAEFADLISKVRQSALEYADHLRNFICTQTERRERRKEGATSWKPYSSLVKELSYYEGQEYYRVISENGKPSKKEWEKLGGSRFSGEFGSLLRSVFEPACQAAFTFGGVVKEEGSDAVILEFVIAQENSRFGVQSEGLFTKEGLFVATRGRCWVEPKTLRIIRLEQSAVDIPHYHPIESMTTRVDYGDVEIQGQPCWLPKRAESIALAGKTFYRNLVEFTEYHELDVQIGIKFSKPPGLQDEGGPLPK